MAGVSALLLVLPALVVAQSFTKITTGPVVTDGGFSEGGSWADFDGDGDLDLYVPNGTSHGADYPNFFYMNNGDGTFTAITTGDIATRSRVSRGSAWGDIDNDGDLDLVVINESGSSIAHANDLFFNQGFGIFTLVTSGPIADDPSSSVDGSWADLDNDGDLDLYEAGLHYSQAYLNAGDGTFTILDQGDLAGINTDGNGGAATAVWADIDNDFDIDLYVASQEGGASDQFNWLYINQGDGIFIRRSAGPTVDDQFNTETASWADYDNDGDVDLFVGNGNAEDQLFNNAGDGTFTEVTGSAIAASLYSSTGSAWGDVDNDGDLDLFVSTGGGNIFFINNGDGTFTRSTSGTLPIINDGGNSAGAVFVDYNNDGYLDLFVANRSGENNFLYQNTGNGNHWFALMADGVVSNKNGIGVKVRVKATIGGSAVWQLRAIASHAGRSAQAGLRVHFGLGDATTIDSLKIEWPSGVVQVLTNVAVDQFLTVTEDLTTFPPAPPADQAAKSGNNSVDLSWTANTEVDFSYYTVYRHTADDAASATVLTDSSLTATAYSDTGLTNGTLYYYWVTASDTGHNESRFRASVSATPAIPPPAITTVDASNLSPTTATLNGLVQPYGLSTVVLFEWGTTNSYGTTVFADQSPVTGTVDVAVTTTLTNLESGTIYHFRVVAGSSAGTSQGPDQVFTTPELFALVTTGPVVTDGGHSIGAAFGDYDGDGNLDLLVANRSDGTSNNSFLYKGNGDGTFTAQTGSAIYSDGGASVAGSWGDLDNDGDLDLFIVNNDGAGYLYLNNGLSIFTRLADASGNNFGPGNPRSAGWADVNNDGNLDLFITNEFGNDFLYLGDGTGGFVLQTAGAIVTNVGRSYSTAWADYDNDGDADLFVANMADNTDFEYENFLYRNDGDGTFTRMTAAIVGSIASDQRSSVTASWADYDNDGDLDLFVGNEESGQGFLKNDYLYINNGDGTFTPATGITPIATDIVTTHSSWGDLDNDGDLDLVLRGYAPQVRLYWNNGDGTFASPVTINPNATGVDGQALALGDVDNDGDLDLLLVHSLFDGAPKPAENVLYLNNGNSNAWGTFTLVGVVSNRAAIGAKVRVKATISGAATWQLREISSQTGRGSQNDMRAHFGLGDATIIDSVKVEWPSGAVQVLTAVAVNQFLTITEEAPPTVAAQAVTDITKVSVTLNGTVNANGDSTAVSFEWGETTSYGTVVAANPDTVTGSSDVAVSASLTGLMAQTTYHYRLVAANSRGTSQGADQTFATEDSISAPAVVTEAASEVTGRSARLNGTVNTEGASTTVTFEWGETTGYGNVVTADQSPLSGTIDTAVSAIITGLQHNTVYHYRVVAVNSGGTSAGADQVFTTVELFALVTTGPVVTDGGHSIGAAFGDYDGDGNLDLLVANQSDGTSNNSFLYRGNGDGTFTAQTGSAIYSDGGASVTGSWGDLDNDGDLDLFIVNNDGAGYLYLNNGLSIFTRLTDASGNTFGVANPRSAGWADVNNDGNLDLFITSEWGNDFLYLGDGTGGFVLQTAGAIVTDMGRSYSIAWADYDNDGDADLFVANRADDPSFEFENFLYRNDGDGTFTRMTSAIVGSIASDQRSSVTASWADYDNDGDLDLFVGNEAGGQGFLKNDYLYINNGDGTFTPATGITPIAIDIHTSTSNWGDLDNDGDLDLIVGQEGNRIRLFWNNGDGTFAEFIQITPEGEASGAEAAALGDVDNDGDLDLFVTLNESNEFGSQPANNALYLNNGNSNAWGTFTLVGVVSNRSAIGAKVRVKATISGAATWQLREISSQTGRGSQNDMRAHFGLGDATIIDSVKVEWPSGQVDYLTNVAVNQFLTITEGVGVAPPPSIGAGQALAFDGVDDYVEVGDDPTLDLTGTFTLESWLSTTSMNLHQPILAKGGDGSINGNYQVVIEGNLSIAFYSDNGRVATNAPIEIDKLYHWAVTYDGSSSLIIYINGEVAGNGEVAPGAANNSALTFGSDASQTSISGILDEIRIWNVTRTQAEIKADMHRRLAGDEPGLVGYWRFDDGTGTLAVDSSPSGNDGTLVNGPTWVASVAPVGDGSSDDQIVTGTGVVAFTGTGLSMDFTSQTGTDTIVVTALTAAPGGTAPDVPLVANRYWIIDRKGTGSLSVDMTFDLGLGSISADDQNTPGNLRLMRRNSNSDGAWTEAAAATSATSSSVTFPGITAFSQFTVGSSSITVSAPAAASNAASDITATTATLNGSVNPGGSSTTVSFEYGLTTSYGSSLTAAQSPLSGTGDLLVSAALSGLDASTTYHYRVVAANSSGTTNGADESFTTASETTVFLPAISGVSASSITASGATLEGSVNAGNASTTVSFEYGTSTSYGSSITATESPLTGNTNVSVSATLTGLAVSTTYHYRVVATNSQGTANGSDQTFATVSEDTDVTGPAISGFTTSATPTSGADITVSAEIADNSGVQEATLHYLLGGQTTFSKTEPMLLQSGTNTYTGTIPASEVTPSGLLYFITSTDGLSNASSSATFSIPVAYASGVITTTMSGSAFSSGFPYEKWRLISLPGDFDNKSLSGTIQGKLGGAPSDATWQLFKYVGPGVNDYQAATAFVGGESYFLKQVVSESAITFELGSGKASDLVGFSITIPSNQWKFISAPYPFNVAVSADPSTFIGPYTYGAFGSGGQAGWSIGQVQTTFRPWGGYIIYNTTAQSQTLTLDPAGLQKSLLAKGTTTPDGWLVTLAVEGEKYFDGGNVVGRRSDALEGLDRHDHPEPPAMENYLSVVVKNSEWPEGVVRTADVRSLDISDGIWDLQLHSRGETGPVMLTYVANGEPPEAVVLLDLLRRSTVDISAGQPAEPITEYSERFPYRLKLFAGSKSYVNAAIDETLASLPQQFALHPNYPNPFNPTTTIGYSLPKPAWVSLKVYNLLGQEILSLVDDWMDMDRHEIVWSGRDQAGRSVASGIYFAVLQTKGHISTQKMVLLK